MRDRGAGRIGIWALGIAALAAVLAAVLTSASGGGSSGGGKASARASSRSAAASLKLSAYKSSDAPGFKVATTMTETISPPNSNAVTVDITLKGSMNPSARTGGMTMNMQVPTGGGSTENLDMQEVLDGNTVYVKMPAALMGRVPGGKPWVSIDLAQMGKTVGLPGLGSAFNGTSNLTSAGEYLDFLRATSDGSVKDLGQQTLDGRQVTLYSADADLAKVPSAVPAADKAGVTQMIAAFKSKGLSTQMPIEAWIDSANLIRRIQLTYNTSLQGASVAMDITEDFSDYGPQPTPTAPSPDQTMSIAALQHHG